MYDVVKEKVNSSKTTQFEDACLGEQHLPSCISKLDGTLTSAADSTSLGSTKIITVADLMSKEHSPDVLSTAWDDVLTLNGTGSGYVLPPCKVLVMIDAQVHKIEKDPGGNASGSNQAWVAAYHVEDVGSGSTNVFSPLNMGFVYGAMPSSTHPTLYDSVEHPVSIWFIIDKTALSSAWTLEKVVLRGACGWGVGTMGSADPPDEIQISQAHISICAFYRDA
tara:strand:- start:21753 stop:22418 length:666 start_codon:yes stop_codon:yes gene_type:complete